MKQVRGIWLPDSDEHLAREIALPINPLVDGKGTYQLNKYHAAMKHVAQRRCALDIGANVGLWSRVMVRDFDLVVAIEPVAAHRACFLRNVPTPSGLLSCAIGSKAGRLKINVPPAHTASASVATEGEEVNVLTLDSLEAENVDFVKIDIEGYEYEAVLGGEQTIRQNRPVIVIEQKPGNAERYGRGQWDAVELLRLWGMLDAEVIGGDHVMVWQ